MQNTEIPITVITSFFLYSSHNILIFILFQCSDPSVISVFLLSTYTDGAPPVTAEWFCRWVYEAADDFRVQKSFLSGVKFTVFALGHSLYDANYCLAGKNLFDRLSKLSARPVYELGLGDQNVAQSVNGGKYLFMHTIPLKKFQMKL